jgi:alkanesulfonate monooxygenase SsuD/methylene tetrahydromethanopterin reductase-like flavin-dependent oxidoreductase (luciferase family)
MRHAVDAIQHYRSRFEPSRGRPEPYAILAVTAVCADTSEEAHRLAAPLRVAIVKNRTGRRSPIVSIEEALAYPFTPEETAIADDFFLGAVIGEPAHLAERLMALARETGANEIMLSTLVPSLDARRGSLERIARVMA